MKNVNIRNVFGGRERVIKHSSGCTICLYPMGEFSSAYALFGTKYGSVDTTFKTKYDNEFVRYEECLDESGFISGLAVANKDCTKVTVMGNEERILLMAAYDNLGKGASGAAVECMNMAIGADKKKGLVL